MALRHFRRMVFVFAALLLCSPSLSTQLFAQTAGTDIEMDEADAANLPEPQVITYNSDGLNLMGYLYKPAGNGPFPAYMWNHGSDKMPKQFKPVAKFWLDHVFVFYLPIRHGHGDNPGPWIVDEEKALRASGENKRQIGPQVIALHEKES